MTSRRRRIQTRNRRFGHGVWSPPDHNDHVRRTKSTRRAVAFMASVGLPLLPWQRAVLARDLAKLRRRTAPTHTDQRRVLPKLGAHVTNHTIDETRLTPEPTP